ncbi:MAG: hypothetical protein ACRD44_13935 [Bryobacteraceae bacterium]
MPATGKTTIARALATEIAALHLRIDSIEHAIRLSAVRASIDEPDAVGVVGHTLELDVHSVGQRVRRDRLRHDRARRCRIDLPKLHRLDAVARRRRECPDARLAGRDGTVVGLQHAGCRETRRSCCRKAGIRSA